MVATPTLVCVPPQAQGGGDAVLLHTVWGHGRGVGSCTQNKQIFVEIERTLDESGVEVVNAQHAFDEGKGTGSH